ncbi:hypothetical protein MSAN_00075700 [Mycena sanguinolenta]|uniref:RING-CH-type domain-containing protein n=1 Tax=Mycena sanguinolenta TaxID=230812 RepID=A0A8H6ZF73_9AGAR|nr:hypothetical protein MSAN_00075700 [Mycena sanguinolenta]
MNHVPTLQDLRLKSCFICLEEEHASDGRPDNRPVVPRKRSVWVHPCPKCALVAHDRCLLRWISSLPLRGRSKRNSPSRSSAHTIFDLETFKCPHCGHPYELITPFPSTMHRLSMIYDSIYMILAELVDIGCMALGLATIQVIPLSFSLQSRLFVLSGLFVYEVAFLESYLGSRMFNLLITNDVKDLIRSFFIVVPTIPFRLLLPVTPRFIIPLYLAFPLILHGMTEFGALEPSPTPTDIPSTSLPMISTWPPSPALLGLVIVPMIRPIYNRLFSRFKTWVLGAPPPLRPRRSLDERARGFFGLRPRAPTLADTANAEDPDAPPLVIADQIIQKDQSSWTHAALHAVASVVFPRIFGNMLHEMSRHPSCGYLRTFLGLRPSVGLTRGDARSYYYPYPGWEGMPLRQRALAASQTVGGLLLGGSWIWADVDPVWWRNSLGYGIFVLAKDCFELYRLWLQKKEVQSRTIKSRDFAGVDIRELDLVAPERFIM